MFPVSQYGFSSVWLGFSVISWPLSRLPISLTSLSPPSPFLSLVSRISLSVSRLPHLFSRPRSSHGPIRCWRIAAPPETLPKSPDLLGRPCVPFICVASLPRRLGCVLVVQLGPILTSLAAPARRTGGGRGAEQRCPPALGRPVSIQASGSFMVVWRRRCLFATSSAMRRTSGWGGGLEWGLE